MAGSDSMLAVSVQLYAGCECPAARGRGSASTEPFSATVRVRHYVQEVIDMEAANRAGRMIGVFIIIQMIGSGMVNFVMEGPLSDAPGFLVNAAPHSRQIAAAVLLGPWTRTKRLLRARSAVATFFH